jgi:hypothetical protein
MRFGQEIQKVPRLRFEVRRVGGNFLKKVSPVVAYGNYFPLSKTFLVSIIIIAFSKQLIFYEKYP